MKKSIKVCSALVICLAVLYFLQALLVPKYMLTSQEGA